MKQIITAIASLITAFGVSAGDVLIDNSTIPTDNITEACQSIVKEYDNDAAIVLSISNAYKCEDNTKLAVKLVGYDKYVAIPASTTTLRNKVVDDNYIDTSDTGQTYALQLLVRSITNKVFFDWSWSSPTRYGMDDKFEFEIDSWTNKEYKYVVVHAIMYNAVNDKVKSQVFRGIGPVIKRGSGSWTFDNQHFDMYNVAYIKVTKVVFIDMSNKQTTFTNKSLSNLYKTDADYVIDNTAKWFSTMIK
jgi:hypothetical protein